jgi:polyhydroxybutyrate depolymerase
MRTLMIPAVILVVLVAGCAAEPAESARPAVSADPAPTPTTSVDAAPTPTTSVDAGPASTAGPGLAPGDHEIPLRHDGLDRRYLVHVPPETGPGALPVIIALHGGGGTAAQYKADIGLDEIADREGFIAVYPDGFGLLADAIHTWNGGFNCCGPAQRRNVDDVGFIRSVVSDLGSKTDIDPARIAVTGHSNGAIMAYRVAAEASDLVSVAVPVAGAMALEEFAPAGPVAILHIHSVDDPRALYDGGEGPPFPGTNSTVLHEPVVDGLAAWAAANGCDPSPEEVGSGTAGDQSFIRFAYTGCVEGGQVEHLRLAGIGHGWPGITTGREGILGPATTLVDASEEVWAFASRSWND